MSVAFTNDFVYAPGSGTVISLDDLVVVVDGKFYKFSSLVYADDYDGKPALLLEETDPESDTDIFIDANVAVGE